MYSLFFLFNLELIIFRSEWVFFVGILALLSALLEGKRVGKQWKFAIFPFFFSLSSIILLYLITLEFEQQIFILLASFMYYLAVFGAYRLGLYEKDETARGMMMAVAVASIFFMYAGLYGLYLNFLVPLFVLMIAYFITTFLISYQYFSIIRKDDPKKVLIYSFLLAFSMMEIIWTMNFWPFGYLTTGVIALILYYVLWDIIQSHFLDKLSKKKIVANMVFFSMMIGFVLITSKWIPII